MLIINAGGQTGCCRCSSSTLAVSGAAAGAHPQRWRVNGAADGGYPQRWREVAAPVLILNAGGKRPLPCSSSTLAGKRSVGAILRAVTGPLPVVILNAGG
ncbi:hypothetical protein [Klebsiella pneumoniae]|uniref:hypothetical protein n=1 Tax=Klebsiella pneumoniae TaxID=573 RepID=UPI00188F1572|nr:hypothetical protein [Klebsiella pneumoniae]